MPNKNDELKKTRGRPRKNQQKSSLKSSAKKKLTLLEKQNKKLEIQRQRELNKNQTNIDNNKYYCTNKDLQNELILWRDSNKTEEEKLRNKWLKKYPTKSEQIKNPLIIDYTKRTISNNLGKMIIDIGNKLLNRSEFRNYPKELKEDMRGFGILKIIKGLKNYNFQFNNPFAFFTTAFWNSYLTVIAKHYKQLNIRKDLTTKMLSELESFNGVDPSSGLAKYIKQYIGDDIFLNDND